MIKFNFKKAYIQITEANDMRLARLFKILKLDNFLKLGVDGRHKPLSLAVPLF